MLVVTSTSTKDYRANLVRNLMNMPHSRHIDLDEESFKMFEKVFLSSYFYFASRAENRLTRFIQENYGGTIVLLFQLKSVTNSK
jgi:hypothetical protein